MLGILFTFSGRLSRLSYFLTLLGIGFAFMLGVGVIMAGAAMAGAGRVMVFVMIILLALPWLWVGLSVQAARLRDIGLAPGRLIAAVIALGVAAQALAYLVPDAPITWIAQVVAGLGNLAFSLLLLFFPSHAFGGGSDPGILDSDAPERRSAAPPSAVPQPARSEPARPGPATAIANGRPAFGPRPSFGRRGMG